MTEIPHYLSLPFELAYDAVAQKKKTGNILDLCCGDLRHTRRLIEYGFVDAVDIQPDILDMIFWATPTVVDIKPHKINIKADRFEFFQQDARSFLQESLNGYDVIFMSSAMYFFNPEDIFNGFRYTLAPGGRFISIETNGSNPILNTYRWIKNFFTKRRKEEVKRGLIKISEIESWALRFHYSVIIYCDLLTLFTPVVGKLWPSKAPDYFEWAAHMDAKLAQFKLLRYFFFRILFVGTTR